MATATKKYKVIGTRPVRHDGVDKVTGRARYEGRRAVVERINKQQGGKATLIRLPDVGMKGNSHMMMQDRNNLQVADFVLDWIGSNIK